MDYVVGFAFSRDGREVVLIRKENPEWQRGMLNGPGGKIEAGEQPLDAMSREFVEETGVLVPAENWSLVSLMQGQNFRVWFYTTRLDDPHTCQTTTAEEVLVMPSLPVPTPCVASVQYLIPLCLEENLLRPVILTHSTGTDTGSPLAAMIQSEAKTLVGNPEIKNAQYACCDDCGWHGPISDLKDGPSPLDELCPECGSRSTWWTDDAPDDE